MGRTHRVTDRRARSHTLAREMTASLPRLLQRIVGLAHGLAELVGLALTAGAVYLCLFTTLSPAQNANSQDTKAQNSGGKRDLRIYFVDVEGGQATLFVTPGGQSLLIDTGFPDNRNRDADRIAATAKQAGLTRIDYVLVTHYHLDHVGGVPQLAAEFPIRAFIDHGPDREAAPVSGWQNTAQVYDAYQKLLATGKYQHLVVHPGDKLPIKELDATVVSGDGMVIDHPLPGAGAANPACGASDATPAGIDDPDMSENGRSLGIVIRFGRVRILDPGDLTWDRERMLMCPVNKLGHINLFVVGNHGTTGSTSPALLDAIAPQVVVMNNGAMKGASTPVLDLIRNAPSKPALWQLHFAQKAGADHNTEPAMIANTEAPVGRGPAQTLDKGFMLRVTVNRDGRFTVFNDRTGESANYTANK